MSDDFNSRLTAQFRKKPVVITALQWTGENLVEALAFTGKHPKWNEWFEDYKAYEKYVKANGNIFKIFTLEGTMEASPGDWIIRGVKGEHYPCKPDIFAATYEPAALPAQPAHGEADRAEIERLRADLKAIKAERDDALTFLDNAVSKAPEPLKALGKWLADMMDEDDWPTAERYLNAAVKSVAEARLTAIEADRVKVAETALRMAAEVADELADEVLRGHNQGDRASSRILAITPAAVLAAVDSACTPT